MLSSPRPVASTRLFSLLLSVEKEEPLLLLTLHSLSSQQQEQEQPLCLAAWLTVHLRPWPSLFPPSPLSPLSPCLLIVQMYTLKFVVVDFHLSSGWLLSSLLFPASFSIYEV